MARHPPAFRDGGPRTRRLVVALGRRAATPRHARHGFDARQQALFEPAAIVYTDTADFTRRVRRHGILHFLMAFTAALPAVAGRPLAVVRLPLPRRQRVRRRSASGVG